MDCETSRWHRKISKWWSFATQGCRKDSRRHKTAQRSLLGSELSMGTAGPPNESLVREAEGELDRSRAGHCTNPPQEHRSVRELDERSYNNLLVQAVRQIPEGAKTFGRRGQGCASVASQTLVPSSRGLLGPRCGQLNLFQVLGDRLSKSRDSL